MNKKRYTVGELAKLSGATIRTIQYYDRINLLVAQRDKNKKLRYYNKNDLMRLQQILFYKRIGMPLKEIKNHLTNFNDFSDMKKILNKQADILFQQEMEIKMNLIIIKVVENSIELNPDKDIEPIIKLICGLNKQTVLDYANVEYDEQTKKVFQSRDIDYREIIDFYWQWKQLILEAAALKLNSNQYENEAGYQLGEKWDRFTKNATDDPEILAEYERGSDLSDQWPEEDLFLYNFSKAFIEAAHRYYLERKGEIND
ncbi:MerR family transcriptional regulator [Oceanobacillus alkalisoli]|uniref:MerR family transcriptional regulator n=1 Tax=Oceanobacillus alkalisoli TaxID=2925113 RepID=UPI001EF10D0E|nr:MerR family transcriptional regulator [Oceanobacillus alkalisoli]MCF3944491.1 MerR family transcriptional regulator [Oceanobacillus alkalisoli]MCG5103381.1 MerR family transcriptional regulator [Oceanobacillus alkalisoli]